MFFKKYLIYELDKLLSPREPDPDTSKVRQMETFVPVTDKNGNLMTVGMQQEFEPVESAFDSYGPDFAIKSGHVSPVLIYPPSVFSLVENVNSLIVKSEKDK